MAKWLRVTMQRVGNVGRGSILRLGLSLLLVLPQPSAGACLFLSFANTMTEHIPVPLSEERSGNQEHESVAVRCDRHECDPARLSAHVLKVNSPPVPSATRRTSVFVGAGQRQDQCGAGIRTRC